jgi:hypothetical protein
LFLFNQLALVLCDTESASHIKKNLHIGAGCCVTKKNNVVFSKSSLNYRVNFKSLWRTTFTQRFKYFSPNINWRFPTSGTQRHAARLRRTKVSEKNTASGSKSKNSKLYLYTNLHRTISQKAATFNKHQGTNLKYGKGTVN